ncbi:MAG: NAD(P)-dependent alcohol dehydrogenase [Verrucomicrobiales bacterium]|nr:NAD(P)-dependent alcohol dehydrogenase [Verrucomicrobiales bacterium]
MRAFQITGTEGFPSLQLTTLPDPQPGPSEVLVRIRSVSLNYRDCMNVLGIRGVTGPVPRIPCSDAAGEIAALGPEVTDWQVGDRVVLPFMPSWLSGPFTQDHAAAALGGAIDGVLRDLIALPAASLVAVPEGVTLDQAATLPCAAVTAWNALITRGGLQPGQTVLILGSGGVSVFALSIARLAGARVLAITSSDEKAHRLRQLGAAEVLNYRDTPDWHLWARQQTGGEGVDHVVEIGGPETLNRSIQAVRHGGHIALIGVLTGTVGQIETVHLLRKGLRLNGIYVGSRDLLAQVTQCVAQGGLLPVIDRVFPFEASAEALRHLESGAHFGKIVIQL